MTVRAQELCGSRGGRPGLPVPVPNKPDGFCEHKATLKRNENQVLPVWPSAKALHGLAVRVRFCSLPFSLKIVDC